MLIWSFVLAGVGLIGLWLQGSGRWYGWAFTIVGQSVWITFSLLFGQWGFLLGTAGYIYVASRNLRRWRRLHRAGQATPGTDRPAACACPCACPPDAVREEPLTRVGRMVLWWQKRRSQGALWRRGGIAAGEGGDGQ